MLKKLILALFVIVSLPAFAQGIQEDTCAQFCNFGCKTDHDTVRYMTILISQCQFLFQRGQAL